MPVSYFDKIEMPFVGAILKKLKDFAITSNSEEPLLIGNISDFSKEELSELLNEKIYFVKNKIYLHSNETIVHIFGAVILSTAFEGLPSVKDTVAAFPYTYIDKFNCGHCFSKHADFFLVDRLTLKPCVPGEIAFTNETFEEFLIEGLNYVNEYSNANYFIGLKIMPGRAKFSAFFIVLKKTLRPLEDEIERIVAILKSEKYFEDFTKCQLLQGDCEISENFFIQNGAELLFSRNINDENYSDDFQLVLEGSLVHPDIKSLLTITVKGHYISLLRDAYYQHLSSQKK